MQGGIVWGGGGVDVDVKDGGHGEGGESWVGSLVLALVDREPGCQSEKWVKERKGHEMASP